MQYVVFAIEQLSIGSRNNTQNLEVRNDRARYFYDDNSRPLRLDRLLPKSDRDDLPAVVQLPSWIESTKTAYANMENRLEIGSPSQMFTFIL